MKRLLYISLVFLAGFFFWAFRKDEAKDSGLYKVDPGKSGVTWEGKKVIGGHNGTIQIKDGSVNYNGNTITSGTFTIDMSTIKSLDLEGEKKQKLEHHLMSPDFFDATKYPLTTFKIKKVERRSGDQAWATGMLTIKETTREISFPITMNAVNGRLEVTAKKIKVDRTKFGVEFASKTLKSSLGDKAIDDEFTIGFSLIMTK
ncbi:YceI family protein [Taibaiella koreensis]|uniref:YceI family protein n=1 Tax=Taibaiella koreensis TaxID=1268548 RepID=UPI000E59C546|nr:YceI family protein [Taibaiella koreensis]